MSAMEKSDLPEVAEKRVKKQAKRAARDGACQMVDQRDDSTL